jgi:Uma2 family endonuclease
MSMTAPAPITPEYWYPDSDGVPMSENMKQGRLIRMLISGFDRLYRDDPNVLVGGDCFWYPVEEDRSICVSPDVIVVFDTPKADHPSVRTFEHGGVVRFVAEVVSPSNTYVEMRRKRQFYEDHGVDEYWVYDPETGDLEVWYRGGDRLDAVVRPDNGWMSPLLGITVRTDADGELYVTDPDGEVWLDSREEGRVALARRRMLAEFERQVQQMRGQLDTAMASLDATTNRAEAANLRAEAAELRAVSAESRITGLESDLAAIRVELDRLGSRNQ